MRTTPDSTSTRRMAQSLLIILSLVVVTFDSHHAYAIEPLRDEDEPAFFERVLTKPGAVLHRSPGGPAIKTPRVFDILYVYDRDQQPWIAVGRRSDGTIDGFVREEFTEDWHTMLVMRLSPRGTRRARTLFFENIGALYDLAYDESGDELAREMLRQIEVANTVPDGVIAVEPEEVPHLERSHLFPILDHEPDAVYLDYATEPTHFLQIASIGERKSRTLTNDDRDPFQDIKIAVTFVFDTTKSMGPYIEGAKDLVERVLLTAQREGLLGQVTFGLVGYRDYLSYNPEIVYQSQIFQHLDSAATTRDIKQSLDQIWASPVSTDGWDEDAYAGLYTAITGLNWSDFDVRLLILVTDAGIRPANDPRVQFPYKDHRVITTAARDRGLAIFPIHLHTREALKAQNTVKAERDHRRLGRTGDLNTPKYLAISTGSPQQFYAKVENAAETIVGTLKRFKTGKGLVANKMVQASLAPGAKEWQSIDAGNGATDDDLAELVFNEIFRVQLEYLGRHRQIAAPEFFRAWVAEHDLTAPKNRAFTVDVFLTRTQLADLASRLRNLLDKIGRNEVSARQVLDEAQGLSARTSVDPVLEPDFDVKKVLPSFLERLPYKSDVLRLTPDYWRDMGRTGQLLFIEDLEFKLGLYQDISNSKFGWTDFERTEGEDGPEGDRGLHVYRLPLVHLP